MTMRYLSQCSQNQQDRRTFDLVPVDGFRPIGFCVNLTGAGKVVRNVQFPEAVEFSSSNSARVPDAWPAGLVMFLCYSDARRTDIDNGVWTGPGRDFRTTPLSVLRIRNHALKIAAMSRVRVDRTPMITTDNPPPEQPAMASVERSILQESIDKQAHAFELPTDLLARADKLISQLQDSYFVFSLAQSFIAADIDKGVDEFLRTMKDFTNDPKALFSIPAHK